MNKALIAIAVVVFIASRFFAAAVLTGNLS